EHVALVERDLGAEQLVGEAGEEAVLARREPHLGPGLPDDLAVVGALELAHALPVAFEKVGEPVDQLRALVAAGSRPGRLEAAARGGDRVGTVLRAGLGDRRPRRAGVRVDRIEAPAVAAFAPAAIDEQGVVRNAHGCSSSLKSTWPWNRRRAVR